MTDSTTALIADFRREVRDKLAVAHHCAVNPHRTPREIALQQCEDFLMEQFTEALRVLREERASIAEEWNETVADLTALRSALTALREKAVNIVGMCQDAVDDRWPPHIAVDEAQKVAAAIVTELDAALLVPAGGRKNDDQTRVDGRGTEGPTGSTAPAA